MRKKNIWEFRGLLVHFTSATVHKSQGINWPKIAITIGKYEGTYLDIQNPKNKPLSWTQIYILALIAKRLLSTTKSHAESIWTLEHECMVAATSSILANLHLLFDGSLTIIDWWIYNSRNSEYACVQTFKSVVKQ